jgi:hypothetical protein
MEENIIKGEVTDITYFGLKVYDEKFVRDEDIKQLPFYNFWAESAQNSTCFMHDDQRLIYLHDWERFCKLFIKTGKHRFQF